MLLSCLFNRTSTIISSSYLRRSITTVHFTAAPLTRLSPSSIRRKKITWSSSSSSSSSSFTTLSVHSTHYNNYHVNLKDDKKNMSLPQKSKVEVELTSNDALIEKIKLQGEIVRQLKKDKEVDLNVLSVELEKLKLLKEEKIKFDAVNKIGGETASVEEKKVGNKGGNAKSSGGGGGKVKKFTLKTPKGTKDWEPSDMILRQDIFNKITKVFELHGGVTIDTPVFELREILAGKYGEDSKLIYDLQDQGGEICSLRYDLTVPFARFLAMHGTQYPQIKRYHIAKVYRRDQPAMSKGRMREFYQCDFDIAGAGHDKMIPDAEILLIAVQVLEALEIGDFTIKINHRKILDGLFAVCGVPLDKTRAISSAVDKLDKLPWEEVKKEMTEQKGLDPVVADQIGEYVKLKGSKELVETLLGDVKLSGNKSAKEGIEEMGTLFRYLDVYGVTDRMSFDLSLARGLDYYTGIIYEAVTEGSAPPPPPSSTQASSSSSTSTKPTKKIGQDGEPPELDESTVGVGSIAAGGRYDELVGMFSSGNQIPCVGISFGVERLFSLLLAKANAANATLVKRNKLTEVYVMALPGGFLEERMKLCNELWSKGIKTETIYKTKKGGLAGKQWEYLKENSIPFAVIIGQEEIENGMVRVKAQVGKEQAEGQGDLIKREELGDYLLKELGR